MIRQIIQHRVNKIEQLLALPLAYGAEIDLRYHNDTLVLHHDPYHHQLQPRPDDFEAWLQHWQDRTAPLILNLKTEGIERDCIALMQKYHVQNYFFLDMSMPYSIIFAQHASKGTIDGFSPENLCIRFSEYEPLEYALSFTGKAKWLWVDHFTHCPLNADNIQRIAQAGFKICLTAPELQGCDASLALSIREQCKDFDIHAVCTKRPELWQ